jgi:hypothetical protein
MKKLHALITKLEKDADLRPPIAKKASKKLARKWRWLLRNPKKAFDNKAHSKAFEDVVFEEIRAHLGKDVTVRTREIKRIRSLIGIGAEADVFILPKNLRRKPVTIVSCKITLAPQSLKESIGEAYVLGKLFKKHKLRLRYYMVATFKYHYKSKAQMREIDEFTSVSRHYLQRIYTLTEKTFLDSLVNELKTTYK